MMLLRLADYLRFLLLADEYPLVTGRQYPGADGLRHTAVVLFGLPAGFLLLVFLMAAVDGWGPLSGWTLP